MSIEPLIYFVVGYVCGFLTCLFIMITKLLERERERMRAIKALKALNDVMVTFTEMIIDLIRRL